MHPPNSGRNKLVALSLDVARIGEALHDHAESLIRAVHEITKIPPVTDRSDRLLPRLIFGKLAVENLAIQLPPGMAEEISADATATTPAQRPDNASIAPVVMVATTTMAMLLTMLLTMMVVVAADRLAPPDGNIG